jgi:hypothetical protein
MVVGKVMDFFVWVHDVCKGAAELVVLKIHLYEWKQIDLNASRPWITIVRYDGLDYFWGMCNVLYLALNHGKESVDVVRQVHPVNGASRLEADRAKFGAELLAQLG